MTPARGAAPAGRARVRRVLRAAKDCDIAAYNVGWDAGNHSDDYIRDEGASALRAARRALAHVIRDELRAASAPRRRRK